MKIPHVIRIVIFLTILAAAPAIFAQEPNPVREKTRERLNALLQRLGPEMGVTFKPSSKSQFVFTGVLREGLKNAEQFEIVLSSIKNSDQFVGELRPAIDGTNAP